MSQTLVQAQPRYAPKEALAAASDSLQEILAGNVAGRERDWAEGVARALLQVERELRRHHTAAQAPDGQLVTVDHMRPTIFRQWGILCLHYQDLLKRV